MKKRVMLLAAIFALFCGVQAWAAETVPVDPVVYDEIMDMVVGGVVVPSGTYALNSNQVSRILAFMDDKGISWDTVDGGTVTVIPVGGAGGYITLRITSGESLILQDKSGVFHVVASVSYYASSSSEVQASATRTFDIQATPSDPYNLSSTPSSNVMFTYAMGTNRYYDDDDSSGGCSAFAAGAVLSLLAPMAFVLLKKKK